MTRFVSSYLPLDIPHRWLRGNHHGHSNVSDGQDSPLDIATAYEEHGYHYLALSEHDTLLKTDEVQAHTSMCILPAVEVTTRFRQTVMYLGADHVLPAKKLTAKEIMGQVHASGGLFILDHPNWRPWPNYATDGLLDSLDGLRGMEIYTGVIERLPGRALATDRWDRLLSKGWRVFGHGTDDQHQPGDYFIAWNQVQWLADDPITAPGILSALANGRFYASTGVTIDRVGIDDDGRQILIESDADEIHWTTREGIIVKKEKSYKSTLTLKELAAATRSQYTETEQALYVRAECLGHGNSLAWSQPFWIES